MPLELKNYYKMLKHPYRKEFEASIEEEIKKALSINTFE